MAFPDRLGWRPWPFRRSQRQEVTAHESSLTSAMIHAVFVPDRRASCPDEAHRGMQRAKLRPPCDKSVGMTVRLQPIYERRQAGVQEVDRNARRTNFLSVAKGPLSAHRNCQTSGPRFRCLLIRLPCCIPASSISVAMRKNSYAVSPKPGLRQTVGVNCFAAAVTFKPVGSNQASATKVDAKRGDHRLPWYANS
jgi:hypothetical protein